MYIIDAHNHIASSPLFESYHQLMEEAINNNVKMMMIVSSSVEEFKNSLIIKNDYPFVDLALGFHPNDCEKISEDDLVFLEQVAAKKQIVAVGEIGFDYHYNQNRSLQKQLFKRQIAIANKYNLPIVIHSREAMADTIAMMDQVKCKGMMHCYSGSLESAKICVQKGFFISLSGVLTFKNANKLLDVAKEIDENYLLVETDSPYLTPVPLRGKTNHPSYVKYTFEFLAQLKELEQEYLGNCIINNYYRLFHGKS